MNCGLLIENERILKFETGPPARFEVCAGPPEWFEVSHLRMPVRFEVFERLLVWFVVKENEKRDRPLFKLQTTNLKS